MKGFAFVYLEMEPGGSEEVLCSKLQGLKIGDVVLNVELDRKHHPQLKDSGKGTFVNDVAQLKQGGNHLRCYFPGLLKL